MRRLGIIGLWAALAACLSTSCGMREREREPEFVLTYAENQTEDYPTTLGAGRFAKLVEEKTQGRIVILVKDSGVLGDEREIIEQLRFGGVDFARVSLSPLAELVPKLNVLQMPYLYTDSSHMWKVLDGDMGDEFLESFEGTQLVALSWYDAGARNFYNSVRPITKPEDMEGLRIRVQESSLMSEIVTSLGATPVQLPYGEVYPSLKAGLIDGAENNWPSYESESHYEVAGYLTMDEHTRVPELQLCSGVTWEKLTLSDREIIRDCAQQSAEYQRELWAERERLSREKVRKSGTNIIQLTPREKARFQERVSSLYETFCGENMELVEAILEAGT